MSALSIATAQRVSEAIKRLGACGAVVRETGLAPTSLDRYVRFCKECSLLPQETRLIGDRYFNGDEPIVTMVANTDIEDLINNTVERYGHMDVPPVDPPTYRRGPHVSIDIGDLHRTDEDFMWLCYQSVIDKLVSEVRELNPGHVTVNIFGDWITGTGIFPGQAARNLTNHPHWQVIAGAYMIFELFSLLKEATGLRAEMNYILGNHDILNDRSGGVKTNLGYFLCNEIIATYGIPIQYRGTEAVIDYGDENGASRFALCVHGFGSSNFTPHPNSLQQRMKDKTLNLNATRPKEEFITEVRHGHCFDDQTELLTRTGWVKHDQLTDESIVMSYNREMDTTEWNQVSKVFRYSLDELPEAKELIHIRNVCGIDLAITPGHGLWVENVDKKEWYSSTAEDEYGKKRRMKLAAPFVGDGIELTDAQIRVLAWIMSEGNISTYREDGTPGDIRISQSDAPDGRLDFLMQDIAEAGLEFSKIKYADKGSIGVFHKESGPQEYTRNYDAYRIGVQDASNKWREWLGRYITAKRLPKAALWGVDARQARIFLDTYIQGDGSVSDGWDGKWRSNSSQISTKDLEIADFLQSLVLKTGRRSSLIKRSDENIYVLTLNERNTAIAKAAYPEKGLKGSWSKKPYSGIAWCVSVPNGALVVRRGGKTTITLNTHWIDTGTEITRTLTFRSCGGFQRNKRAALGQVQRSAGVLLTIADGEAYIVKKVQPDNDIFEAEINSYDLEIKNMRRLGELLEVALNARIARMDCN